ncbi:MAG: putative toxin-antitoxin system toxin component, PIN family [Muribaculaceae bacterium]
MIYAVVDTNVIISALITHNQNSATRLILDNMVSQNIIPVYNDEIIDEYKEVMNRSKFHFAEAKVKEILKMIVKFGIHSNRIPYDGDMPDEKDRPFYEVSLSIESSFLVTGNLKHFPITPKVVSPAELMAILEGRKD